MKASDINRAYDLVDTFNFLELKIKALDRVPFFQIKFLHDGTSFETSIEDNHPEFTNIQASLMNYLNQQKENLIKSGAEIGLEFEPIEES